MIYMIGLQRLYLKYYRSKLHDCYSQVPQDVWEKLVAKTIDTIELGAISYASKFLEKEE